MVQLKRGVVVSATPEHRGLTSCAVEVDGAREQAIAYDALTGTVAVGDAVILNTTAVALGLGTGGVHIVVAVEGRPVPEIPSGHAMKLRYTPHQTAVEAIEETHRKPIDDVRSLDGMPVVVAGLHSALAPVLIGARSVSPTLRTAYVMTDGAALLLAYSKTVPALQAAGLLDVTFTTGQAFGGDHEAVTLHGALAGARAVARADVVVVAMGPGNLGTGSRWGFASIEVAAVINAVAAMGGRPIVVPRISFADARERHQGVSHHTLTALSLSLARATIVLPPLDPERASLVAERLGSVSRTHDIAEVELGDAERALKDSPVELHSMGRTFDEDPDNFRTAAAAGVHAARLVT